MDAANAATKLAALLRDARGVQRRLDKLAAGMADAFGSASASDPSAKHATLSHNAHSRADTAPVGTLTAGVGAGDAVGTIEFECAREPLPPPTPPQQR